MISGKTVDMNDKIVLNDYENVDDCCRWFGQTSNGLAGA
jgi:hypothetical protein